MMHIALLSHVAIIILPRLPLALLLVQHQEPMQGTRCDEETDFSTECNLQTLNTSKYSAKPIVGANPSLRYNHVCSGNQYHKWLSTHAANLTLWKHTARSFQFKGGLFFIGNSHTCQVYEAFLDALEKDIRKFEVTECNNEHLHGGYHCSPREATLDHYPLVEKRFGVDQTNSLPVGNVTYAMGYSRTTLKNGARLFTANNARFLYEKENGLDKIIAHLGIDLAQLDGVVIGAFNSLEWAEQYFWPEGRRRQEERGEWSKGDLMQALRKRGFRGRVMIWGQFGKRHHGPNNWNSLPFDEIQSPLTGQNALVPCSALDCGMDKEDHQCIPGVPTQVAAAIVATMHA